MTAFFKSWPLKMEALRSFETSGTTDAMTSFIYRQSWRPATIFNFVSSYHPFNHSQVFLSFFLSFFFLWQPVALSDGDRHADCCCQVCDVVQFGSATFEQYTITLKYCSIQRSPISESPLTFGRFPGFAMFVLLLRATSRCKMNTEQWWNDTDRGKLKYFEKNLFQCHFIHHK